jgi:hypothetical protein
MLPVGASGAAEPSWPVTDPRLWRFAALPAPLAVGRANLGRLKRLQQLYLEASFVDPSLVPAVQVEPGDRQRPPPRRAGWQASIRQVDLRPRLGEIRMPALVCVGRHDPQTPWPANATIAVACLPAAWRSSSAPATTRSWRSPTASPSWWAPSSPRSPARRLGEAAASDRIPPDAWSRGAWRPPAPASRHAARHGRRPGPLGCRSAGRPGSAAQARMGSRISRLPRNSR